MNKTAFIGIHGRKGNGAVLTNCTRSRGVGHRYNLVMAATLVAFHVNNNWIPETKLTANQERNENLQGFESTSMTSN